MKYSAGLLQDTKSLCKGPNAKRKVNVVEMKSLVSLVGVLQKDRVRNKEVGSRAGT